MLLTIKEVAQVLKVSVPTIYTYLDKGMPVIRHGKVVRFEEHEVMQWFKNNSQ